MSSPESSRAAAEPSHDSQSEFRTNNEFAAAPVKDDPSSNVGPAASVPEDSQNMEAMTAKLGANGKWNTAQDTGPANTGAAEQVAETGAGKPTQQGETEAPALHPASNEDKNAETNTKESLDILKPDHAQSHEAEGVGKATEAGSMETSTATLKPDPAQKLEINTTQAPTTDNTHLDFKPRTPLSINTSQATSASSLYAPGQRSFERSPARSDAGFDEKPSASEDERDGDSRSEIQNIMDQFSTEGGGPGVEEVMSPRLGFAAPLLGSQIQHPPRKSSLDPINQGLAQATQALESTHLPQGSSSKRQSVDSDNGPEVPPKPPSMRNGLAPIRRVDSHHSQAESSMPPQSASLFRPPPPEPEPEPNLPFDFHRFLEQLRHRTADPVAKFLRSFLLEFGKKQWMVHEQVKIIGDFLAFITNKMAQCEVWREVSDAEFDNAREGMEKLVMNRLYAQTFSPAIPPPRPIPGARPRRSNGERPLGPRRRGQHQEDIERDNVLSQKIQIYGWVREEHLDIPSAGESGKRFLKLSQQELLKIKTYRAPRDKIICVLNCCKVIFGLLKHSKSDTSADSFMPLLIYTVLHANPEHLVSNVQYILRFRNQEKLSGEAGYYLSSLLGAVQFIEGLDRTSLTVSDEEFEKNVEAAVSEIAERHRMEEDAAPPIPPKQYPETSTAGSSETSFRRPAERDSSAYEADSGDSDEPAPISGLLRSIQKPLSTISRIFTDDEPAQGGTATSTSPSTAQGLPPPPQRVAGSQRRAGRSSESAVRKQLSAEDAAVRQASAETAQARRLQRKEHESVVETLSGMFPDLDKELISDVVAEKEGRVGLAVDACLVLNS